MHILIAAQRAAIAEVCRRYQVRRLKVFGSAARGTDFDPERSDADFLVEFAPDAMADLGGWFSVQTELEGLLGRGVDLVESGRAQPLRARGHRPDAGAGLCRVTRAHI